MFKVQKDSLDIACSNTSLLLAGPLFRENRNADSGLMIHMGVSYSDNAPAYQYKHTGPLSMLCHQITDSLHGKSTWGYNVGDMYCECGQLGSVARRPSSGERLFQK